MPLLERLPLALVAFVACSPFRPPFTQPEGAGVQTDAHQATLVFLWPPTSCDPAGHLTLATADGQFLGNISRGSRLSVLVPAGERTVVAWNDVMEAVTNGAVSLATTPALHVDLREGRTYYARIAFGEWTEEGPPIRGRLEGTLVVRRNQYYSRRWCVAVPEGTTSSILAVSPALAGWDDLPEWMNELEEMVPDSVAGQTWLDRHRALLEAHSAIGHDHFVGLRPEAKRLATLEPADGEPQ